MSFQISLASEKLLELHFFVVNVVSSAHSQHTPQPTKNGLATHQLRNTDIEGSASCQWKHEVRGLLADLRRVKQEALLFWLLLLTQITLLLVMCLILRELEREVCIIIKVIAYANDSLIFNLFFDCMRQIFEQFV